jgi:Na+-driven multidrug efflux pump
MKKRFTILKFSKEELRWDSNKCRQLLGIGVPMGLQFSITAIGSVILQVAVNSLGAVSVAAVTSANRLQMMFTQPLETLGLTMSTYCGQNLGAKKVSRIHTGIRTSLMLSFSYCVILFFVIMLFAPKLSLLFVHASETEVISRTVTFLRVNSFFYLALGLLFIIRNSLQGLGYSVLPMFAGVVELVGRSVIALCFVSLFHFKAICFAGPLAWILADVLLVIVYYVKVIKGNVLERG